MERPSHRTDAEAAGFLVEGRVQGVGFRWWTMRAARELGLRGTVHNRPDGRVEVHAAGPPEALIRLEELLARGPRAARVEAVRRIPPRADLPPEFRIVG